MPGGGRGPFWKQGPVLARGGAGGAFRWIAVRVGAVLAVAAVLFATVGVLLQRAGSGPVAAWARSTGHDAVWLGHAWVTGKYSRADLRRLTSRIGASGMSDVYVFAGALDAAGRLAPADYSRAAEFLRSFHAALPGVRVSAWLGGVTGGDRIDLGDPATRGHIVASAAAVMRAGFGGVHYDLEPVTSGDTGLLALLTATRALHPGSLSIAVPKLEPLPGLHVPERLIPGGEVFWTTSYLTQVAKLVDQVAVMSYDTGMPFPSWYSGYIERETALALRAVPHGTALLMGLPAYYDHTLGHHTGAETVAAAIHGIRVAVTAAGRGRPGVFGVALFADYSAKPRDWAAYQRDWTWPG